MSSEQPPKEQKKKLLYLDKSTPEEFQNAELMDWIYLVGDISTQYELDFVRQFGHAMKSRSHPAQARSGCDGCRKETEHLDCPTPGHCDQMKCPICCEGSDFPTLPEEIKKYEAEAARKAREDVLDKVIAWKRKHGYWFTVNQISGEKRYHFEPDRFEEFIKELRITTPQSGQEERER